MFTAHVLPTELSPQSSEGVFIRIIVCPSLPPCLPKEVELDSPGQVLVFLSLGVGWGRLLSGPVWIKMQLLAYEYAGRRIEHLV